MAHGRGHCPAAITEGTVLRIDALGWSPAWAEKFDRVRSAGWEPARVAVEDRGAYVVFGEQGEMSARVAGRFMAEACAPADFPKVGDWVGIEPVRGEEKAVIQTVLPRTSQLARKVPGRETEAQVLVTNVDRAFIVQALDASFNPRLLQRYLAMVREAGVEAVVLLNKEDLHDHVRERHREALALSEPSTVLDVSARTGLGLGKLRALLPSGATAVFVGQSGVGKSSLINRLFGERLQATAEVRASDAKGRHTTSWRELIVLPDGGLVIDTPGMREFHLWMAGDDVREAFPDIEALALQCKFTNCCHSSEKGCAVQLDISAGRLSLERLEHYRKLRRELDALERARQWRSGGQVGAAHVAQKRFQKPHRRPQWRHQLDPSEEDD